MSTERENKRPLYYIRSFRRLTVPSGQPALLHPIKGEAVYSAGLTGLFIPRAVSQEPPIPVQIL
jgi:hypothetical protein